VTPLASGARDRATVVSGDGADPALERWVIDRPLGRFVAYGLIGWCAEVAFTGVHDFVKTRDSRLLARSSLWMFPIYGLLQPLFEPLHDGMRGRVPAPGRAAVYGVLIMAVEYASGAILRRAVGRAPWDYSSARCNVHGLVRLDYLALWAAAGLATERVHDRLTGR
jgi:uncharacterized membrane protein